MNNKRSSHSFEITEISEFKKRILSFYKNEKHFVFLDSNTAEKTDYQCLCAIGAIDVLSCDAGDAFAKAESFQSEHQDWMFGYLGYDLKNELESLDSKNPDLLEFPDLQFFIPEIVVEIGVNNVVFHSYEEDTTYFQQLLSEIINQEVLSALNFSKQGKLSARDSKDEYLKKANNFLNHIQRGDIYEANLCTEFHAVNVQLQAVKAFQDLNENSQPPFAAYARFDHHHIISASPERYLKKSGNQLLSQPIKGTARRSQDPAEDESLKIELLQNQKERSENVMIVDLVRNDMSKIADKGSVVVSELFGLYTFPQVHHMISSITAKLSDQYSGMDAIKATFPMGSMTGAPKVSAMKIIEKEESFKRGVYSGAVGYFNPQGDFDFNVVIRTILYNARKQMVSLSVGSAITAAAIPESEYEECLLKAAALMDVLKLQGIDFA